LRRGGRKRLEGRAPSAIVGARVHLLVIVGKLIS